MRKNTIGNGEDWLSWTHKLLHGCKNALNQLLPFTQNESAFLDQLYDHGKLEATLLTSDSDMIQKIHSHPLLKWKTQIVAKNKRRS